MATIVEYYEVIQDSGGFDIDFRPYPCARFLTLSAAEEYAKLDKYRRVNKTKSKLVVYDTVQEIEDQKREDLREAALKKLTPQERLILGV